MRPLPVLALAIALGLAAPAAVAADSRQAAQDTGFAGLRLVDGGDLQHAASLGIRFGHVAEDATLGGGLYRCGGLAAAEAGPAAATVAAALRHLPDEALRALRLRYVVLCAGVADGSRSSGGLPVAARDLLMLDASDGDSLEHRTLHELYHLLEYRFGGIGDRGWNERFGGYSNAYPGLLRQSELGSGKAGFANAWCETHPHEDRAELFAYLLTAPYELASLARERDDAVLRRKAAYLSDKCHRLLDLQLALPD